ncbi:hypothetical protein H5410_028718 [Solanum commersonii]|uniref:Uncharacterized protein n=1 Tax=Solanum commersonii TaxID=4109 RepID=A0A9J5Z3G4_SOLCO|nr:hypothetical protein H5410_028718 [Solanum commersonii]
MSDQKSLHSLKKTLFYNLFPSKDEEETCKLNNTPYVLTQELIEIRDIYPPSKIDSENSWQIKKKITRDKVIVGKLVIQFFEMFEYILLYWTLDAAKILENGCDVPLTCGMLQRKIFLRSMKVEVRGLSVGDELDFIGILHLQVCEGKET